MEIWEWVGISADDMSELPISLSGICGRSVHLHTIYDAEPRGPSRRQEGNMASQQTAPQLPLAKYASNLAFLTFLLTSTTVFLPRSSKSGLAQRSSADRPEHPFLTPLTADPLRTMVLEVGGVGVVMAWWGTRMRGWWFPRLKRDGTKEPAEGLVQVATVRHAHYQVAYLTDRLQRMGRATVVTLLVSLFVAPLLFALGAQLDE